MALSFDLRRAVHEVLSHDTGTSGSPRDLLAYLMDLLYYADFRIIEQAAAFSDSDHTNLVGIRGPGAYGGLLLCSSVPSVGAVDSELWGETEEDPFNATERDGLLFGLGAASAKVDLICKILAAASVDADSLKSPVVIAGLFGEDARVGGAMYLMDSGICIPQWAVIGEPTALELVTAHRGQLVMQAAVELPQQAAPTGGRVFRIEVHGEAAHAANPSLGRNAIDLALRTIARFRTRGAGFTTHRLHGGGQRGCVPAACTFDLHTDSTDWLPSGPYLTVESLEDSGDLGPPLDRAIDNWQHFLTRLHELFRWTAPDTAPDFLPSTPIYSLSAAFTAEDSLWLGLDYRTLPGQRTEQLVRDVEALARRMSEPGVRITIDVERNLLPMDASEDSSLVQAARECLSAVGVPPVVSTYSGYAEGWIFHASGVETMLFGPGMALAQAHRPNEYTPLVHLERATAFYEKLIRRLCT